MRRPLVAALALLAGGCTHVSPPLSLNSCADRPGGWCADASAVAKESWRYAVLAQNAYADRRDYQVLPEGFALRHRADNDRYGFAYALFDRWEGERLAETVIAFRGGELGRPSDWLYGLLGTQQRRRGAQLFDAVRAQLDESGWPEVKLTLVGHSMGGAIAMQVSQDRPGADAFVFNSSRGFRANPAAAPARRVAVIERGELLNALRGHKPVPGEAALQLDCHPRAGPFADHNIRRLANCLTWIAAYSDEEAQSLLLANAIDPPPADRPALQAGAHQPVVK